VLCALLSLSLRTNQLMFLSGKWDEKNEAHVGGNQWQGGTGGSDTAGMGGRGGPVRASSYSVDVCI
jgi:hypothetical protein